MKLENEDKTRKFAGGRSWKLWDGPRLAGPRGWVVVEETAELPSRPASGGGTKAQNPARGKKKK